MNMVSLLEASCIMPLRIETACHYDDDERDGWYIEGLLNGGWGRPFCIRETVTKKGPAGRVARLWGPPGYIDITADQEMYHAAWRAFLAGDSGRSFQEALEVQQLLEEVARGAGNDVDQE
jgi:hypothetical protein